jgi:hypothetical protein
MLTTRKNVSKTLIAFTVAIAAAAVFTSSASAKSDDSRPQGYLGITQQNAGSGGVTPTDLARAVPRESNAPAGVTPTDLARTVPSNDNVAPSVTTTKDTEASWGFVDRDLAVGFSLGLAIAILCSLALALSRGRMRVAHS